MPQSHIKDPQAVLDYKFDWKALTNGSGKSDWLEDAETIASFEVTPDDGITVDSSSLTDSNTSVTVWLSGGTDEQAYEVTCAITTSAGRTDERTITVVCVQR